MYSTCCMLGARGSGGGGVITYMVIVGMCGPKGCVFFQRVLVINRISILAIMVLNRVWFLVL